MKQTTLKKKTGLSRILTLSLFVYTLMFLPYAACNNDGRAYKDGDVMLGGLFSVHFAGNGERCGDLYTMGLGHVEAMIFAIEEINNNSNILPNMTLGYDIRDYCESTALAMQITYDFVRDANPVVKATKVGSKPISALVGPYNSASALLVGGLLQVANISAIGLATSIELSSRLYKDFFRTVPPDNWQAKVMADIIELFNWTYVAAVGLDDSYGRNGIWALEKESYERNFCVAFSEFIPRQGYQQKMKQSIANIKRKPSIGVIIVWLSGGYGRAFFKEATDNNLEEKTLILSDALTAEEAVYLDPRFTILDGSLGIQPRDYPVSAFEEYLKGITPEKVVKRGMIWWDELWKSHFNCTTTKSNDPASAACKENLMSHNPVTKLRSSFVPYIIDAVNAFAHALDSIYRCLAMPSTLSKGSCPSVQPTVKGSDLQKYLRNVSFDGLTGKVQFDSSGDPLAASYDIINFKRESSKDKAYKKLLLGFWDKDSVPKLKINTSSLRWKSLSTPKSFCASECLPGTVKALTTPCCWDCIKCPPGTISTENGSSRCKECEPETTSNEMRNKCDHLPIINITLTTATGISITVVVLMGFAFTLIVCAYFIKFYNSPVVKASSREISFLLLFGIAALFGLSVLEMVEPSNLLCSTASFWRYSALNLCITVLFFKTMRITGVFEIDMVAQLFTPFFKTVRRQAIFIFVLNSVAFILTTLWMSIDPPGREKIIRSDEYIFLVCKPFYTNTGFSLFIALCAYTLIVALLCTYYAFKARGIPENFNETKYIGFSMYILLLSSLAYYPVAFSFESWYVTLVSCSTTLVTSFGLLSCMFGPKVYVLLFRPQQNTLESVRSQVAQYSFNLTVLETRVLPIPKG